ncbi:uncharacterized protein MYCFIDRAFT_180756 [Pseudocercospora fijiensis CIRAD86]|uniref:Uncharacterized protein n=1 Tax=Pseudocercospora fijiensis (strain CIRAD86) TaxID=383855 RepID=M2ZCF6_PSEFD|nr:uncharacterized protein MYCFIDRAFT_180756 [Pseudocercospora fijiensis CIRAD86]EME76769.1 hypothetical protein MYCFIDRAFT_180756 [Pseudocercospora fijiensis CIRAD86]
MNSGDWDRQGEGGNGARYKGEAGDEMLLVFELSIASQAHLVDRRSFKSANLFTSHTELFLLPVSLKLPEMQARMKQPTMWRSQPGVQFSLHTSSPLFEACGVEIFHPFCIACRERSERASRSAVASPEPFLSLLRWLCCCLLRCGGVWSFPRFWLHAAAPSSFAEEREIDSTPTCFGAYTQTPGRGKRSGSIRIVESLVDLDEVSPDKTTIAADQGADEDDTGFNAWHIIAGSNPCIQGGIHAVQLTESAHVPPWSKEMHLEAPLAKLDEIPNMASKKLEDQHKKQAENCEKHSLLPSSTTWRSTTACLPFLGRTVIIRSRGSIGRRQKIIDSKFRRRSEKSPCQNKLACPLPSRSISEIPPIPNL